ncbi:DUF6932 family protein [Nioella sp.]|uniref:DUF6932 family protein n=1 Tax=Nioella sp. TaxID=1912091 RepID=UPI003B5259B1
MLGGFDTNRLSTVFRYYWVSEVTVPNWNVYGVIPPIRPGQPGHSPDRSPYKSDLMYFCERFCTSIARYKILNGFLAYRKEIQNLGIVDGFQWLDGSFLELIEASGPRDPGDIDVVTFANPPTGNNLSVSLASRADLTDFDLAKKTYYVDPYYMTLGGAFMPWQVQMTSYWYSLWSHRKKDGLWKGFVQISLDPSEDTNVKQRLDQVCKSRGLS